MPTTSHNHERIVLRSVLLQEERPIRIALPASYSKTIDQLFPVIFVLDAEWSFDYTVGIARYLAHFSQMPDAIVVGIDNVDRGRDFAVKPEASNSDERDHPKAFLAFLRQEVIPYVENNYRAASFRVLIGHSLAGLFASYAFVQNPALYQSWILIAPSIHRNEPQLVSDLDKRFPASLERPTFLHITMGDEPPIRRRSVESWVHALEQKSAARLIWSYERMPSEDHFSIAPRSVAHALREVFADWHLDFWGIVESDENAIHTIGDLLENKSAELTERYGFDVTYLMPERLLEAAAENLLANDQAKLAFNLAKINARMYPGSTEASRLVARCHRALGRVDRTLPLGAPRNK